MPPFSLPQAFLSSAYAIQEGENPMGRWRIANTGLQKHPLVATAMPVRITTVDAETDPSTGKTFFRSAEETTANLSRGGAYVQSREPLSSGRRVIVAIEIPQSDELQLEGRVVWTRRALRPNTKGEIQTASYGIEFESATRELATLERYLKSLLSRPAAKPVKQDSPVPPTQP